VYSGTEYIFPGLLLKYYLPTIIIIIRSSSIISLGGHYYLNRDSVYAIYIDLLKVPYRCHVNCWLPIKIISFLWTNL
jgi:hypothetical protein